MLFLVIYFIELLLVFMLYLYTRWSPKNKKVKKFKDKLVKKLFFGEILVLLIEAYFEFMISCVINLKSPIATIEGETLSVVISYAVFAICVFILPSLMIWLAWRPLTKLNDETFKLKWGALYDGVKL